jgi:hypothetical protein
MNHENRMRCIPEDPEFGEGFHAEKAVWTALKNSLPDDCVLAHSVQVRDGRNEYEIDLLVLWPNVGMAAIEVKGGQVSIADGQWYQSDRNQKRKIQSPVAQSQSSLHALKNWLENQLGSRLSSRCVYMVSLPYTDVPRDWAMAGCPRSLILDQTDSKSPAEQVRQAIENEGGGASPLAPAFLDRIVRKLGGDLDTAVVPSTTSQEDEAAQDHLTERQSVLLQATRSLPRIRFTGGAGSGKTWLAVEKARMLSKQGKRVGLFCYNKGLGQYLQDRVATWRQAKPVFTGEFHEYVRGLGVPDGTGQEYFDVEMPRLLKELAAGMEPQQRLDAVIVDEAQDFAPLWWDALLACTTDPDAGEVYAFMDDRQDVYQRWGGATADLTAGPTATFVPIHIDDNLRNTRKIAESFRPFAGEHFTPRGSTGLPVTVCGLPHGGRARRGRGLCGGADRGRLGQQPDSAPHHQGPAPHPPGLLRARCHRGILARVPRQRSGVLRPRAGLQGPGTVCGCSVRQRLQGHGPGSGTALCGAVPCAEPAGGCG